MKFLVILFIIKIFARINIFKLLNYIVAGASQMLSLVNQNKQHARKHTAILQVMTTWRSYISAPYPKITSYQIKLSGYINTYSFIKYTREYSARSRICQQKLGITSLSFLQDIKNGVSNSYFVKIKTFRLQMCKLLENRRKTYTRFFIRKIFIRKWASKTQKTLRKC